VDEEPLSSHSLPVILVISPDRRID